MKRKGFTLVELMVVVTIIGILAAIAIPLYLDYLKEAKTAEAYGSLKAIGDGAMIFYNSEHGQKVDDSTLSDGGGGTSAVFSSRYPHQDDLPDGQTWLACTSTGNEPGQKTVPNSADYDKWPWSALNFALSKPHIYQYCYGAAENTKFTATARASFSSGSTEPDSILELIGTIQGEGRTRKPILGDVSEIK